MPKKSNKKKPPKDINKLAAFIISESTKDKSLATHSHTVRKIKKR